MFTDYSVNLSGPVQSVARKRNALAAEAKVRRLWGVAMGVAIVGDTQFSPIGQCGAHGDGVISLGWQPIAPRAVTILDRWPSGRRRAPGEQAAEP